MRVAALVLAMIVTLYWIGVALQIMRVRWLRGQWPAVVPAGAPGRLLWSIWALVIGWWIVQPWLVALDWARVLRPIDVLVSPVAQWIGVGLAAAALAATVWCWHCMGEVWQMAVDAQRPTRLVTHGPFRLVRHPIYTLSALLMLATVAVVPTPAAFTAAAVHLIFLTVQALREERHLLHLHGADYAAYQAATGRFVPRGRWPTASRRKSTECMAD